MRQILWLSLLLGFFGSSEDADFRGSWKTTFGTLVFEQEGTAVVGRYGPNKKIRGTVEGKRLSFTYSEPTETGEGWFELDEKDRFSGKWRRQTEAGWSRWGNWNGERHSSVRKPFEGVWKTSFGRMRLHYQGEEIHGTYSSFGGSSVQGKMTSDTRLKFQYQEKHARGEGWFELTEDARSFSGKWRAEKDKNWKNWQGTWVEPDPHQTWLIIFEAPWETSIAQEEYAFGDMLESYFEMDSARHIKCRHKSFHDLEDLKRWCRELAWIAEPVHLLISTHGTQAGLSVGSETIGPEELAQCLIQVPNIQLLHLSGCSMMKGDFPDRVHKARSPEMRFPITGYTTPVAWDASALADFTYLSMLLIRRLDPEKAVQQTHKLAPFTSDSVPPGSEFRALGLTLSLPNQDG